MNVTHEAICPSCSSKQRGPHIDQEIARAESLPGAVRETKFELARVEYHVIWHLGVITSHSMVQDQDEPNDGVKCLGDSLPGSGSVFINNEDTNIRRDNSSAIYRISGGVDEHVIRFPRDALPSVFSGLATKLVCV